MRQFEYPRNPCTNSNIHIPEAGPNHPSTQHANNTKIIVPFFVKVFDQSDYAEAFTRGELYMKRLPCYRKVEDGGTRSDEYEGILLADSPGMMLELVGQLDSGEIVARHQIGRQEMAEPIETRANAPERFHPLCMYAAYISNNDFVDSSVDIRRKMVLPERIAEFGEHADVIPYPRTLLERVKIAVKREHFGFWAGQVQYYDPTEGPPPLPFGAETAFIKRNDYDYQSEYRIAIDTGIEGTNPYTLNVDDLRDITNRRRSDDSRPIEIRGFG